MTSIMLSLCLIILLLAIAGFFGLRSMKKPPQRIAAEERPIKVETSAAMRGNYPVLLTGHGELKSYRTVVLSAEVSGTITSLHPKLHAGNIIEKGELLFGIDDVDYQTDYTSSRERLEILTNDLELARRELKRVKNLFDQNRVGSIADVEAKQKAVNTAEDRLAQVRQTMKRARINLERCRVTAPFTCRVISRSIEMGQYVSPGMNAVEIADDSLLEVEFPLYGKNGLTWLPLRRTTNNDANWFTVPEGIQVSIHWTESQDAVFSGYLHRVSSYDSATRSLNLITRIHPGEQSQESTISPVAGMFVSVEVPGRTMENVFALPRAAVSFENTVYVVRENRLYTTPVQVIRAQGDSVFIDEGISEGDQVIITRLIDPLESSLVQIVKKNNGEAR